MAKRPVFMPSPNGRLVDEHSVDFEWFPGFAVGQKRRSIESLHRSAGDKLGLTHVLEVSTKSTENLGRLLSAFRLTLECGARSRSVLLEAAYQGSKVFATAGPFEELYALRSGRDVKARMRRFAKDRLKEFQFDGCTWDLEPKTAFYDWLYVNAVGQLAAVEPGIDEALEQYEGFTDIEFNPKKSLNCQARSCALYVALLQAGELQTATEAPGTFVSTLRRHGYGEDAAPDLFAGA